MRDARVRTGRHEVVPRLPLRKLIGVPPSSGPQQDTGSYIHVFRFGSVVPRISRFACLCCMCICHAVSKRRSKTFAGEELSWNVHRRSWEIRAFNLFWHGIFGLLLS